MASLSNLGTVLPRSLTVTAILLALGLVTSPRVARADRPATPATRLRLQAGSSGAVRYNLAAAFLTVGVGATADLVSGPWGIGVDAGYDYIPVDDGKHDLALAAHLYREFRFAGGGVVRLSPTIAADLLFLDQYRTDRVLMVTGLLRAQIERADSLCLGLVVDVGYGEPVVGELYNDHDEVIEGDGFYARVGLYAAHDWLH